MQLHQFFPRQSSHRHCHCPICSPSLVSCFLAEIKNMGHYKDFKHSSSIKWNIKAKGTSVAGSKHWGTLSNLPSSAVISTINITMKNMPWAWIHHFSMVTQGICASRSDCFSCLLSLQSEYWTLCAAETNTKISTPKAVQDVWPPDVGDKYAAELKEYMRVLSSSRSSYPSSNVGYGICGSQS